MSVSASFGAVGLHQPLDPVLVRLACRQLGPRHRPFLMAQTSAIEEPSPLQQDSSPPTSLRTVEMLEWLLVSFLQALPILIRLTSLDTYTLVLTCAYAINRLTDLLQW